MVVAEALVQPIARSHSQTSAQKPSAGSRPRPRTHQVTTGPTAHAGSRIQASHRWPRNLTSSRSSSGGIVPASTTHGHCRVVKNPRLGGGWRATRSSAGLAWPPWLRAEACCWPGGGIVVMVLPTVEPLDVAAMKLLKFPTPCIPAWFASDFVTQIERWISQHLLGLLTRGGGADHARPPAWDRPARPPRKAVLVPVAEVRDLAAAGAAGDH